MTKIDIVSGFLGAGKTTLIKKMLSEAYQGEKLVLIENEFGEISIDGGFLKDSGVQISEMSSGCICCSLVGDFNKALRQVHEQFAPDRILIEPSGVGKLSDVIVAVENTVRDEPDMKLNSFVTVADATKVKVYMKNFGEFYNNQIEAAGTIILSRTQKLSQEKLEAAVALLREKNPTAAILTTPWDQLDGKTLLSAVEKVSLADELLARMQAEHEAEEAEHHHHHHDHDEHDDHDEHEHHHDHDEDEDHCCCGHHHDDDDDDDEHEHHHHEGCCHHDHEEHDHHHDHDEHEHHHHEHDHEHKHTHHHHTGIQEIRAFIDAVDLPEKVKADAKAVYDIIAQAESTAHGAEIENIHFHEVGSLDAVADVLCVCELLYEITPEKVMASPVNVGYGHVKCAHGIVPVPAPATELILRGVPMYSGRVESELCTPTGAALLKYFVSEYGTMPVLKVSKAGYGTGKKNFEVANVVRAVLGETESKRSQIIELVCNIDDMTAEELSFAMDELFALGAFDVYFTHIGMKKSRPGVMLTCMCSEEKRKKMLRCIFKNTTTLGVREYVCNRYNLSRSMCTAETEYGPVRIKSAEGYGVKRSKCEYEDLAALARANGKTLREIEESAYENQKDKQNI